MSRVRMVHPDLPGRQILVRPQGTAVRRRNGWRTLDEPTPAEASEAPVEQNPPRRRRRTDESEAT